MKYLKLFENYELTEEIEDFVIDLIDSGMIEKGDDERYFKEIKLVKKTSGGAWIPTHYSMTFKLKIKTVLTSLEDVQFNRNLYDKIYQIVYRFGAEFKVSLNHLTLFVKCGDSIKNFYARWSAGSTLIDLEPNTNQKILSLFAVHEIEDDFSVVFYTWPLKGYSLEEALDFAKPLVENETEYKYNAEVWVEESEHRKNIFIRVKP